MKFKPTIAIQIAVISALASAWGGQMEASEVSDDSPLPTIYHADPSHLWNRLHRAFFVRPDLDANAPNPDAVDPPL